MVKIYKVPVYTLFIIGFVIFAFTNIMAVDDFIPIFVSRDGNACLFTDSS